MGMWTVENIHCKHVGRPRLPHSVERQAPVPGTTRANLRTNRCGGRLRRRIRASLVSRGRLSLRRSHGWRQAPQACRSLAKRGRALPAWSRPASPRASSKVRQSPRSRGRLSNQDGTAKALLLYEPAFFRRMSLLYRLSIVAGQTVNGSMKSITGIIFDPSTCAVRATLHRCVNAVACSKFYAIIGKEAA